MAINPERPQMMRPSQIAKALNYWLSVRQPVFIWGKPGTGKSAIVAQVAKSIGARLIDMRLVIMDITDIKGVPYVQDGVTRWAPPAELPRDPDEKVVLFFDEFAQAMQLVQNGVSQLIYDRRLGDYILPENVMIVAASNERGDKAATHEVPSHLRNRFAHLYFGVHLDDWRKWAWENDIDGRVVGFLGLRPDLLLSFDPKLKEEAFASPRTWEATSKLLKKEPDRDILFNVVAGTVGQAAAVEFQGFIEVWHKMVNPDLVLVNPDTTPIPDDPATCYAMSAALIQRANELTMNAIVRYVRKFKDREYTFLTIDGAGKKDPNSMNAPEFTKWALENKEFWERQRNAT